LHILETERLIVRPWSHEDEEPFCALCADPLVMRHVGDGVGWSPETARQFIADGIAEQHQHGYCRWPLILKDTGALAGFCGFAHRDAGAEIGWRLASQYWGRGLATEAAQAVFRYGAHVLGFERITATIQSGNDASQRVAEKLGMTLAGRMERNGRETLIYAANCSRANCGQQAVGGDHNATPGSSS
jgi:RimJ/RimL family protein N-acetyltransferase